MASHKSSKIALIAIAIAILIGAAVCGYFVFYLTSTKSYCSNYAQEKAETSDNPDRTNAEMYDQCMKNKGLSGF